MREQHGSSADGTAPDPEPLPDRLAEPDTAAVDDDAGTGRDPYRPL